MAHIFRLCTQIAFKVPEKAHFLFQLDRIITEGMLFNHLLPLNLLYIIKVIVSKRHHFRRVIKVNSA